MSDAAMIAEAEALAIKTWRGVGFAGKPAIVAADTDLVHCTSSGILWGRTK